jgi:subtilase family serine protease
LIDLLLGEIDAVDPIMMQAAAQGQSMFASSGDEGAACGVNGNTNGVPDAGVPSVEYPASSPYVVAAGGTTLETNADGTYDLELAWDAGGGGNSLIETAPAWQSTALGPFAATGFRGVPDVAMDADFILSAADLVSDGADTSNGGTSLSSRIVITLDSPVRRCTRW